MRPYILRRWWTTRISLMGGIVALLWVGTVSSGLAQEEDVLTRGKQLYQRYCAMCHGTYGKGDGPAAEQLLRIRPADLTHITKRYGGPFPFWQMYRIIDGRKEVIGHGIRDMPIWGDWFRIFEMSDADAVRGRIWQLIYYLDSIQEIELPQQK